MLQGCEMEQPAKAPTSETTHRREPPDPVCATHGLVMRMKTNINMIRFAVLSEANKRPVDWLQVTQT